MLKRTNLAPYGAWRVLPLRNGQISLQNPSALALRTQIWFTPEAIILDALQIINDLLWLWRIFCRLVKVFAIRVLIIFGLLFLIVNLTKSPNLAAANLATPPEEAKKVSTLQISTQIKASQAPVFVWPVPKTYISSYFSSFHKGIDIPNPYGGAIKSLAAGKIIFARWDAGGFGNTVVIQHPAGYLSRYSHLSAIAVHVGQEVGGDAVLGRVGTTGIASGSHLHFEVYKDGQPINPLTILP